MESKLYKARSKYESELDTCYSQIEEAVNCEARKAKVETLIRKSRDLWQKATSKNDQLLAPASTASDAEKVIALLEFLSYEANLKHDKFVTRARE